jgi:hypothetical protein
MHLPGARDAPHQPHICITAVSRSSTSLVINSFVENLTIFFKMAFVSILVLGLSTFALGKALMLGSMPISDPMESLCMVWTVVEQPIYINTCFSSSTIATINGFTTTIPKPTCIDITITSSQTLNPPTLTSNAADIQYTTLTTDIYTTVCPSPTTFTYGTRTYTVTDATTITITGAGE